MFPETFSSRVFLILGGFHKGHEQGGDRRKYRKHAKLLNDQRKNTLNFHYVIVSLWLGLRRAGSTPTSERWWSPLTPTERWTFTAKTPSMRIGAVSCTKTPLTCTPCPTLRIRPWRGERRTPALSSQVRLSQTVFILSHHINCPMSGRFVWII